MIDIYEIYTDGKKSWSNTQKYKRDFAKSRSDSERLIKINGKKFEQAIKDFDAKYLGKVHDEEVINDEKDFDIVGDWVLVNTELKTSSNTAADQYSRMMSDGMNSVTENIKMIYSFSANGKCFIYGYPKGLTDEFSIAIFKAKGKYSNYKKRGNWLTIDMKNERFKLKIIDATENSFTAKDDDMLMKFILSTGDNIEPSTRSRK